MLTIREARQNFERGHLRRVIKRAGGCVTTAAELWGVPRAEMYRLLKNHDLISSTTPLLKSNRLATARENFEKRYLRRLMTRARWCVTAASEIADVDRSTMGRLLKRHGLNRPCKPTVRRAINVVREVLYQRASQQ